MTSRGHAAAGVCFAALLLAGPAHAEDNPTIVVLGAGGDLAGRKLMPAFLELQQHDMLPEGARVVGFDRAEMKTSDFRRQVAERTRDLAPQQWKGGQFKKLEGRLSYVSGDLTDPGSMKRLGQELSRIDKERGESGPRLFFLALPPDVVPTALKQLKEAHLLDSRGPPTRVIVEKPFGTDLASARALEKVADQAAGEDNVYRIDHYLGKDGVRDFVALRTGGTLEKAWQSRYIDRVEVRGLESLGIEGRGNFYEQTGALRDMVQSHLLEVASLALMDSPKEKSGNALRRARLKALRSLESLRGKEVDEHVVRGQYDGGADGPGYREEAGAPGSKTETYVALETRVKSGRLKGVPLFVETGKALDGKLGEVVVKFRKLPRSVARELGVHADRPATLTVSIDPKPEIHMSSGGRRIKIDPGRAQGPRIDPYSRLLHEAIRGDRSMFVHQNEVEASWRFLDPIRERWSRGGSDPFTYKRGGKGPLEHIAGRKIPFPGRREGQVGNSRFRSPSLKRRSFGREMLRRRSRRARSRRRLSERSRSARWREIRRRTGRERALRMRERARARGRRTLRESSGKARVR